MTVNMEQGGLYVTDGVVFLVLGDHALVSTTFSVKGLLLAILIGFVFIQTLRKNSHT